MHPPPVMARNHQMARPMTVTDLADLFRHRREAAGLSKSEAARRNGTDRARTRGKLCTSPESRPIARP